MQETDDNNLSLTTPHSSLVKVGVIGVGSMGEKHARVLSKLQDVQLIGVVDIDISRAREIASRYNCKAFKDHSEIMDMIDAAIISTPTTMHFQIAKDFLKNGRDILIEKPITSTVEEAEELISEAKNRGLLLQVGHLERFNAGVCLISRMIRAPRFIESRRLSPFLGRSTDVDVTLDLMIHDIDIILTLVNSEISDLKATGSRVLTDNIDIAYAWLEFENNCTAEVVASRIANEKVRELKVFQHNTYLNLDYQTQEVRSYKKINGNVVNDVQRLEEEEPLLKQLSSFIQCIQSRKQPLVSGVQGKKALQVALKITEMIKNGDQS